MEWKLSNRQIEIGIQSGEAIVSLVNRENGWNWVKKPSPVAFPKTVTVGGEECCLQWEYMGAEMEPCKESGKLALLYRSSKPSMTLKSVWEVKENGGPVEHSIFITNETDGIVELEYSQMVSCDAKVEADGKTSLWNFAKAKLYPFGPYPGEPLADSGVLIHPFEYNSAYNHNVTNEEDNGAPTNYPMLPLEIFNVENRHGLYFGHVFSFGRFCDTTGSDPLKIRHRSYLWDAGVVEMAAGETIPVPGAYIGAYSGEPDEGANQLKSWFWTYKLPKNMREDANEPLVHGCVPAEEDSLKEFLQRYPAKDLGYEVCKIDIPWLDGTPMRSSDWPKCDFKKISNWNPHPEKWPHGMTAGKIIGEYGMRFSLWMCDTFERTYIGCREGIEKQKKALMERSMNFGFDTWRSDFALENRPYDYRTHMGLLEILDYMIENRPGFRYEHCSGAAGLKDFSTLQRISVFTTEDGTTAIRHRKAFYSNSYMICPVQIKADIAYVTVTPNEDLMGIPDPYHNAQYARYIMRSGFLGAYQDCTLAQMYSNLGGYNATHFDDIPAFMEIEKHLKLYRECQRPILRGDCRVYHVLPMPDNVNWDGIEFYNPELQKGSLLVFKPSNEARDGDNKTIQLKGLEPDALYRCEFEERTEQTREVLGSELMEKGLYISGLTGKHASEIVWLSRV